MFQKSIRWTLPARRLTWTKDCFHPAATCRNWTKRRRSSAVWAVKTVWIRWNARTTNCCLLRRFCRWDATRPTPTSRHRSRSVRWWNRRGTRNVPPRPKWAITSTRARCRSTCPPTTWNRAASARANCPNASNLGPPSTTLQTSKVKIHKFLKVKSLPE